MLYTKEGDFMRTGRQSAKRLGSFRDIVKEGNCSPSEGSSDLADANINNVSIKQKYALKAVSELRPIDDNFFSKLAEDKYVCEEILRVILEDPGLEVITVRPQNSVKNLQGRSVCLDALCSTTQRGFCNVEVQRADHDNHFQRVRYNASCITANITDPGSKFENVPDVCVVYISQFDILRKGKTVYRVHLFDDITGIHVDDGLSYVFVNTAVNDGSDIAELMQCFLQTEVNNPKFPNMSRRVGFFKNNKEGVRIMCDAWEKYNDAIRAEGKIEGEIKGKIEAYHDLGLSISEIAEKMDISENEVSRILRDELQALEV